MTGRDTPSGPSRTSGRRLLLISSSAVHGTSYLDHAEEELRALLSAVRVLLFVPYALFDLDAYTEKVAARFATMGIAVDGIHRREDAVQSVREAEALFVGGGNTFRLLRHLQEKGLCSAVRDRVAAGMPYVGSSAGSNVACPTIRTTNDMPIVEVSTLDSLGLVRFQINPHYLDPDPSSTHLGETREERLRQFHEENDAPVVALREGAMLRVEGARVSLRGMRGARVFVKGREAREASVGEDLVGLEG